MSATAEAATETLEFKTELKQLLDLIIHSLYTKKEIFLRELVSNAADAIDKVRFQALTDPGVAEGNTDYKIKLVADKEAGTLTVSDNGIGMSRETVVDNLGTIAKSGTRAFMENLKASQAQDRPELIGQFGVGFYASFMAADKRDRNYPHVPQRRREMGDPTARATFTIEPADKPDPRHGCHRCTCAKTRKNSSTAGRLRQIVQAVFSNFIDQPGRDRHRNGKRTAKRPTEEETINVPPGDLAAAAKTTSSPKSTRTFYKQLSHDLGTAG